MEAPLHSHFCGVVFHIFSYVYMFCCFVLYDFTASQVPTSYTLWSLILLAISHQVNICFTKFMSFFNPDFICIYVFRSSCFS
jgi:hypothetical protein